MKKIFGAIIALVGLTIFVSSSEALIKIETATVQNGVAFIKKNPSPILPIGRAKNGPCLFCFFLSAIIYN